MWNILPQAAPYTPMKKKHSQISRTYLWLRVEKGEEFIGFIVFVVHKKVNAARTEKKKFETPKHRTPTTGAKTLRRFNQTNTYLGPVSRHSDSVRYSVLAIQAANSRAGLQGERQTISLLTIRNITYAKAPHHTEQRTSSSLHPNASELVFFWLSLWYSPDLLFPKTSHYPRKRFGA